MGWFGTYIRDSDRSAFIRHTEPVDLSRGDRLRRVFVIYKLARWKQVMPSPNPSFLSLPVSDRDRIQSSGSATVTVVKYGDYQCPNSALAHAILRGIQPQIGNLRFVYRHFPQPQIHPQAQRAAEAAEAAGVQGRFWQMHDILFQRRHALGNGYLVEYAVELALDIPRFLRDVSGHVFAAKIREDYQSGIDSGVRSTPVFFINGIRYEHDLEIERFMRAIAAADPAQSSE